MIFKMKFNFWSIAIYSVFLIIVSTFVYANVKTLYYYTTRDIKILIKEEILEVQVNNLSETKLIRKNVTSVSIIRNDKDSDGFSSCPSYGINVDVSGVQISLADHFNKKDLIHIGEKIANWATTNLHITND